MAAALTWATGFLIAFLALATVFLALLLAWATVFFALVLALATVFLALLWAFLAWALTWVTVFLACALTLETGFFAGLPLDLLGFFISSTSSKRMAPRKARDSWAVEATRRIIILQRLHAARRHSFAFGAPNGPTPGESSLE
ncbi:hypothetical protein [Oleomonas cavernae]|uniref:hypothetical protein n=1 Tax=Oleomonas cavernae TaxID=2320859 RepID=UPI0011C478DF|nr:hypothetical protein [Oleomonas cavernae]